MRAHAESSAFEPVHFVEGFVEGVLNGAADYQGAPHHFVLHSVAANQAEVYRLTPLSPEVFAAISETWQIWRRAEQAQRSAPGGAPALLLALPEDRERQAELRGFISNWLAASQAFAFLAEGDFERDAAPAGLDALRVKWSRLEALPPLSSGS